MSNKAVQRRGGTTTEHSTFTGLAREITIDTTKNTVVVHDGSTVGGFPLAKEGTVNGTALVSGGIVTQNSSTSINISGGSGVVYNNSTGATVDIFWGAVTNYSLSANIAAGADASYIFIDVTGTAVTRTVDPTGQYLRDLIYLSKVAHRSGGAITNIRNLQLYGEESMINLHEIADAIGSLNLSGNVISNYGATMQIQKTAGTAYRFFFNADSSRKNPSFISDIAVTPITFVYCQQKTGGDVLYTPAQSAIDPAHYDVGNSTLAATGASKFTIQRVYYFPRTNSIYVFYGRVTYTTKSAALAAIITESFDTGTDFFDGAILRSFLVVNGSTTDLSNTGSATFITTGKFSGAGAGSIGTILNEQGIYDSSTQPQITTSAAGGALQIKQGSGSDTDTVLEILDGAGATQTSIKGNGLITAPAYQVGASPGIDASVTTAALVGKTLTISKGLIVGFA
jgi:hypothetical protein